MKESKQPIPVDYPDFTWIGTITAPHGLQGEVKVYPLTDTPEYYLEVDRFFLEHNRVLIPKNILKIRFHKGVWILHLEGIADRNAAELLKKQRLLIEDQKLRPIEESEIFLHDVLNCEVKNLEGEVLGKVVDVLETGANDVYTVSNGKREFMMPAAPHVIKSFDVSHKTIIIDPLIGMLEDES